MEIITVDGKRWPIKYKQNKETVTVQNGTSANNYPDFIGTKMYQNSSSSDIYSLNFAINKFSYVSFKESFKKFVSNEEDAIDDSEYGKLTHIILVHDSWGAIKGLIDGDTKYDTSSIGDIPVSCIFKEHTEDEPAEKKDLEQENDNANSDIDEETNVGELDEADKPALLQLLEDLNELYDNIQNSAVVAAFNDLKSALNDAILNYQKVMNAVKKILALPNSIIGDIRGKLDFFKKQADVIKNMPRATSNLTRFNINAMSYNIGQSGRTPFITKALARGKSGISVAPIV